MANIDERLEALTHSVELIAQMQIKLEQTQMKTEREMRRLGRFVRIIVMDARPVACCKW